MPSSWENVKWEDDVIKDIKIENSSTRYQNTFNKYGYSAYLKGNIYRFGHIKVIPNIITNNIL